MSAEPAQHLVLWRGEDAVIPFQMDPVVDITGWTLRFVAGTTLGAGSNTVDVTGTVTGGAAGTYSYAVASAATVNLPASPRYYWESRRVNTGSYTVLAYGTLDLRERVGPWV